MPEPTVPVPFEPVPPTVPEPTVVPPLVGADSNSGKKATLPSPFTSGVTHFTIRPLTGWSRAMVREKSGSEPAMVSAMPPSSRFASQRVMASVVPVSYTHLDVYKRQSHASMSA